MTEWVHTSWTSMEPEGDTLHTKWRDTWCRWSRWSLRPYTARGRRRDEALDDRHKEREWGRRPYVDGSNWGVKSQSEKRSGKLATERGLRKRRLIRGKKL